MIKMTNLDRRLWYRSEWKLMSECIVRFIKIVSLAIGNSVSFAIFLTDASTMLFTIIEPRH